MKRSKITGIVCTAVLHLGVLALLFLLTFSVPEEQEEGGVPVMLGDAESGGGEEETYSLTEVDVMPSSEEVPESETADRPMISEGIKTAESDKHVTQQFVRQHLEIGIETLKHIQEKNYSVKHLIF